MAIIQTEPKGAQALFADQSQQIAELLDVGVEMSVREGRNHGEILRRREWKATAQETKKNSGHLA